MSRLEFWENDMSNETSIRLIHLLRYIPKSPSKRSLRNFKDHLSNLDFDVSDRTIQRDLLKLSRYFPLICDERSVPHGWSWMKDSKDSDLAAMDKMEALSLSLAHKFLEPLMPVEGYDRIKNLFDQANNILESSEKSHLKKWRDRVRVLPQTQRLIPPFVDQEVYTKIYDALLNGWQLDVQYLKVNAKKPERRIVNPLGIVLQGVVQRLICTMDSDLQDIRHLPLHRFKDASANGEALVEPENFSIDEYLEDQSLSLLRSKKDLKIEVLFEALAGFHLTETPLSQDQKSIETEGGKIRITASVADTEQLRWWLFSFGENVEVLKPKSLRDEFKKRSGSLNRLYN